MRSFKMVLKNISPLNIDPPPMTFTAIGNSWHDHSCKKPVSVQLLIVWLRVHNDWPYVFGMLGLFCRREAQEHRASTEWLCDNITVLLFQGQPCPMRGSLLQNREY
jgi:hypothetical protein